MKFVYKLFKYLLYLLSIPILYLIVAFVLSFITIHPKSDSSAKNHTIYLNTNGIHLDVIFKKADLDSLFLEGLILNTSDDYLAFGWGDENFYINTPTWGDLTFNTAFKAMFLKSSTLIHFTRYKYQYEDWVPVEISEQQFNSLRNYVFDSFQNNDSNSKIILPNKGYGSNDEFYKANGSYTVFYTCNTWLNNGFKKSGLKACLWTPFDFGLLNKYK